MALKLKETFSFRTQPVPPHDFELTVRKPAGWDLFNSSEIYESGVLWPAARIRGRLAGLKIRSLGMVERPRIMTTVFTKDTMSGRERADFRVALEALLDANDDLREFYAFARKDPILGHAVKDLYEMHDTQPASLFNSVVLSICLQMAKMERSNQMMDAINRAYGDSVEFDGRRLTVQPEAERIARLTPEKIAKECNLGYRAKYIIGSARMIAEGFPGHSSDRGHAIRAGEGCSHGAPRRRGLRRGHHQPARGVSDRRVVGGRLRRPLFRKGAD